MWVITGWRRGLCSRFVWSGETQLLNVVEPDRRYCLVFGPVSCAVFPQISHTGCSSITQLFPLLFSAVVVLWSLPKTFLVSLCPHCFFILQIPARAKCWTSRITPKGQLMLTLICDPAIGATARALSSLPEEDASVETTGWCNFCLSESLLLVWDT